MAPVPSRLLPQSLAVARRILTEQVRQWRGLLFWALFPALMLLLFGLIYRENPALSAGFAQVPAGILIGGALFFSCLGGTTVILVAERERRTLRRLLLSPLAPAAYFLGIVGALSVVAAGQTLVVAGIAGALGAPYRGSVALGLAIVALSVVAYVGLGFFFGTRFARRAEDVNGPLAALGVPLLVLGGTFFPVSLLPDSLMQANALNPVFHMNQALKGVAAFGRTAAELAPHLAVLGAFALGALALGVASYRRLLQQERTR
jgi:ABC-2 type transport system permease protein